MARTPFIETGRNGFVRRGEVVNIAGRMTARETAIRYIVDDWLVTEATSGPVGQASKAYYPVPNRAPSTILRVRLRDPSKRLHAIRAEGDALIEGGFELAIQAAQDGSGSGSVTHHPATAGDAGLAAEAAGDSLSGRLLVAPERFRFILERLHQPGARLSVTITLPVYKPALAHETDREGSRQDLYFRHGEAVPITGYAIEVEHGPGRSEPRPQEAVSAPPPIASERPATPDRATLLLALIAGLLVLLLLAELLG